MSDDFNKDESEKGIKREKLNWLLRIITLGDRFSLQDFMIELKKVLWSSLIVFFGVLVSFGLKVKEKNLETESPISIT